MSRKKNLLLQLSLALLMLITAYVPAACQRLFFGKSVSEVRAQLKGMNSLKQQYFPQDRSDTAAPLLIHSFTFSDSLFGIPGTSTLTFGKTQRWKSYSFEFVEYDSTTFAKKYAHIRSTIMAAMGEPGIEIEQAFSPAARWNTKDLQISLSGTLLYSTIQVSYTDKAEE